MNIVIFGANGATGKILTKQALDSGHRVTAVTRCPESRACFVKIFPVAPFAPKMTMFMLFSFLVMYLHNQVMLFPLRRDRFVMTTTCDHHQSRSPPIARITLTGHLRAMSCDELTVRLDGSP